MSVVTCTVALCGRPVEKRGLCGAHYMRMRRTGSVGTAPIRDSAPQTLAERFWSKVNKNGPTLREGLGPCWLWTAATNEHGYGVMRPAGRRSGPTAKAHRVSAELAGLDIDGKNVLHACDNPPCVNPAHLRVGDQRENVRDAMSRDRHVRGSRNGVAKLTEADIPEIRRRAAAGETQNSIAARFGVTQMSISRIATGKGWRHVA